MGYSAYFLIVWDFVRFAREQGIPSTARGSGCGAIVAYTLYLSHVCPLEYDLLFERFLDPNRSEPPDIDIDFCQERRELVIQYVKEKYGHDSVAQIGTFGSLAAKAALKDTGRVLGIPLDRVNAMCKLVPMKGAIALGLKDAMEVPEFKAEYAADPTARNWIDIARKLEGTNRNVGTHAAGVVIADGPITNYIPVQRAVRKGDDQERRQEKRQGQGRRGRHDPVGNGDHRKSRHAEDGLPRPTEPDRSRQRGQADQADPGHRRRPADLPARRPADVRVAPAGRRQGRVPARKRGDPRTLKQMKPDNIRDLIAVLALYRPGPLGGGMVDAYVNRKHGREQWEDAHPVMTDVLSETYGVMVYQEQIMRILNRLGGIDLSKSYACIKAISKKIQEKIDATRADFVTGAGERGVAKEVAEDIFAKIVFFAGYGFNKCVVGETEITDADTGEIISVGDLFETRRAVRVHALGEDGQLRPQLVTNVVWNGRKDVYRLTTELGHRISATANHPFRVLDGWAELGTLEPGDRIAAPRRLDIPAARSWPRHELITLAGLLSEGNTCHPSTLYFYGNDRASWTTSPAPSAGSRTRSRG